MIQLAIGGDAQLDTGELRGGQVEGDDAGGPAGEEGEGVVAGRSDGRADVAGPDVEPLDEDIGVLPALGVTDAAEIGLRGNFTAHVSCPASLSGVQVVWESVGDPVVAAFAGDHGEARITRTPRREVRGGTAACTCCPQLSFVSFKRSFGKRKRTRASPPK